MVFVGVQPVFTHVPPNRPRSMTATVMPALVSRFARAGPAWPVPMIAASYELLMVACSACAAEVEPDRSQSRRMIQVPIDVGHGIESQRMPSCRRATGYPDACSQLARQSHP